MTSKIDLLKLKLSVPSDIVIITHRNPDGDALGSSLAVAQLMNKMMHQVVVVSPSEYPSSFNFLKGIDEMVIFDIEPEVVYEKIKRADIIFCLDFNALDRVDKIGPSILESRAYKILIDHHLDPEGFADYELSDTEASSTCELVYQFIETIGETRTLDVPIAHALMTGIITDTGSFHYATNANTYAIAGKLKELGMDDYMLNDYIYNTKSEKQLRLLGHCLANRMEIIPEYATGIIALTKSDFEEFQIGRGDTEGIVNYILTIKGIKIAVLIMEQPTIVKLSLRSKGEYSVQEIARNHFNGGGHKNAAGGSAYATLDAIVHRLKNVLPQYVDVHNYQNS